MNHNVTKNVDATVLRRFRKFCSEAVNVFAAPPARNITGHYPSPATGPWLTSTPLKTANFRGPPGTNHSLRQTGPWSSADLPIAAQQLRGPWSTGFPLLKTQPSSPGPSNNGLATTTQCQEQSSLIHLLTIRRVLIIYYLHFFSSFGPKWIILM